MVQTKSVIKVTLEIGSPWAVGAVSARDDVDLPILLDPRRPADFRPYLPATSLVGPLRDHLGGEAAAYWLGPEPGALDDSGKPLRVPSRLWALGTRLSPDQRVEQFSTTAIDAERGAALDGSLRSQQRATVSVGERPRSVGGQPSTLDWYLMAEEEVPDTLIDRLRTWQPFLGRGRGTGLGLARVASVTLVTLDLTDPDQLTWWLTGRHAWMNGHSDQTPDGAARATAGDPWREPPSRTYRWEVVEPVAVGSDQPGEAQTSDGRPSTVPRPVRRGGDGTPILPGSSWRGVFRHRLALIMTAVGLPFEDRAEIIKHLFGSASDSASGVQRGRRGRLRFLESVFAPPADGGEVLERSHVAIDRISGGAARGLLFQVTAVRPGSTCTSVIESDDPLEPAYENLLDHVARDIGDGLVGVGGLVTRGYGTLRQIEPRPVRPVDVDELRSLAVALRADRRADGADGLDGKVTA